MRSIPEIDWFNPGDMVVDPYPTYRRLRAEAPIAYAPIMHTTLVTRFDDCREIETHPETYSAVLKDMMHRAMRKPTMLNKDDPEHAGLRAPLTVPLSNRSMKDHWTEVFTHNAHLALENLATTAPNEADLNDDYAAPLSAMNLISLLGFHGVSPEDIARWSLTLIQGLSNVSNDQQVWQRVDEVNDEIDGVIEESAQYLRAHPNASMLSAYLSSTVPWDEIVANMKLAISGGYNEPQHAITSMVWALSEHPDQRAQVVADRDLWPRVFEETLRWISPAAYIPRMVTRDTELGGYKLEEGTLVASMVASANRDESKFSRPDEFDINREETGHFAFGSGVHICAGMWAARLAIGRIGVPMLFDRFPEIRSAEDGREFEWHGFAFRGMTRYPVTW